MFIRALQGHTGKNLDISTFFSQKDSEGTRAIQVSYCFLKIRRFQNNLQKPVPGGFGTSNGRNAVYFSLVSPLDPDTDPRYKPYFHLKNRHGRLFVIDLEAAQNPLEFLPNSERECLVLRHSSVRVPR